MNVAIPKRHALTGEAYRQNFQETKRKYEPFHEFAVVVKLRVSILIAGSLGTEAETTVTSFELLRDLLILKQVLETCSPEMRN